MLSIKDLAVRIDSKLILQGINLEVAAGEVHAMYMRLNSPNGSGKSTLLLTSGDNGKASSGSQRLSHTACNKSGESRC